MSFETATKEQECDAVLAGSLTTVVNPPYPDNALIMRLARDAKAYHIIIKHINKQQLHIVPQKE